MRYEFLSNYELFSFKVLSIGYSDDIEITQAKCSRDQFIIHYVTNGEGYYNEHLIKQNQGFIIPPNYYADYYANKNNKWTFFWVILTASSYQGIKKLFKIDENYIFSYGFKDVIESFGKRITKETLKGYFDYDVWEIFTSIVNEHIKENQINKPNGSRYAKYAKNYFDVNYYKQIKISSLCKLLNVSQPYLYREFKNEYGISLKEYLNTIKIKHAKQLLLTSDLNISQIAESVGYDDVLAFSAFFKKNTKLSPTQFKKLSSKK